MVLYKEFYEFYKPCNLFCLKPSIFWEIFLFFFFGGGGIVGGGKNFSIGYVQSSLKWSFIANPQSAF